jgi:hypothetical protein
MESCQPIKRLKDKKKEKKKKKQKEEEEELHCGFLVIHCDRVRIVGPYYLLFCVPVSVN